MTVGSEYEGFEEVRAIIRRRRVRIGLPIGVVAMMLIALASIFIYVYEIMSADVLALSRGVILNLQSRIKTEVRAYLEPIPGIIQLSRDLLAHGVNTEIARDPYERLFNGMLDNAPQLTALYIGEADGEFLMVRRCHEGGRVCRETKWIRKAPSRADGFEIEWHKYDADGRPVSTAVQPWDGYDPRQRPWYQGAQSQRSLFWTDVYPFFTERVAGITAAAPIVDAEGATRAVVGADVTLASISAFLRTLSIGKTGLALIVDRKGRVIAHPRAELVRNVDDRTLRLTMVADLNDPVVRRAFDEYRVEGNGRRDFALDGRRYISSASSLRRLVHRDWSILVVVPEDDFIGFVADNVGKALAMALGVIALAAVLAGLLIRQSLRADRAATRIIERQTQLDAEAEAFGQLAAGRANLFDPAEPQALDLVSESASRAARVRRVSIWGFDADRDAIICVDCFDCDTGGHTGDLRLARQDHPQLFAALERGELLRTVDAAKEPALASLKYHYLAPFGCRALLAVPIQMQDHVTGALWFEDGGPRTDWPEDTVRFAKALANLLAISVSVSPTGSLPMPPPIQTRPHAGGGVPTRIRQYDLDTSLGDRRAATFTARLAARAESQGRSGALVFDQLAVMALRLTDAVVLAEPVPEASDKTTVEFLLQELQAAAADNDIDYLKFFSDQVVASVDPHENSTEALSRIAEFAICVKGICERLFARQQAALAFRIGIDLGPAIGSLLGRERGAFVFWGESVQMARTMADTGLPGAIQVTESVYAKLKGGYLFQLRGHHYVEGLGELATYLLGGGK
jgi:adenylate cyclase